MIMTQKEMLFIVQSQLAIDLNCSVDDRNGEKDSIIFVEAKENPGCRPFPRKARYFEILSMGKSIVVSATPERLSIAKTQMQGKNRDTVFSLPFIIGLYLHFLPDLKRIKPMETPNFFSFELIKREEVVSRLFDVTRFNEAIIYDTNLPWQTDLVVLAKQDGEIVVSGDKNKVPLKVAIIAAFLFYRYKFLSRVKDKNLYRLPKRTRT